MRDIKNIAGAVLAGMLCALTCPRASAGAVVDWSNSDAAAGLIRRAAGLASSAGRTQAGPKAPLPATDASEDQNRRDAIRKMRKALCGTYVLLEFRDVLVARMVDEPGRLGDWYFRNPEAIGSLKEAAKENGQTFGSFPDTVLEPFNFADGRTYNDLSPDEMTKYLGVKEEIIRQATAKARSEYNPSCRSI